MFYINFVIRENFNIELIGKSLYFKENKETTIICKEIIGKYSYFTKKMIGNLPYFMKK